MENEVFEKFSVPKAVLTLAIPTMLGQLSTIIYNVTDTYFVSLTNDEYQIAAVTLALPVSLIIMSLGAVFGYGGSSYISRLLGQKEDEKIKNVSAFCVYSGLILCLLVLIVGIVGLKPITYLTGAGDENFIHTYNYLKIIILGAPFIFYSNMLIHIIRSTGMAKEASMGLIIGTVTNIILDYIFIVPLSMGVAGAALATIIGNIMNVLYYLYLFGRKKLVLSISPKYFKISKEIVSNVIGVGIPGAMVTVLLSISNIILNNTISTYGSIVIAAYGIASKVNSFAVMLTVGLAQGVAPLIGYYYGAKNYKKLKETIRFTTGVSITMGLCFTVIFILARNPIAALFIKDAEFIGVTTTFLCIITLSNPILGISNLVNAMFQAVGKPMQSLMITLSRQLIVFIPVLIITSRFFGVNAVIGSQVISDVIVTIIAFLLYKNFISSNLVNKNMVVEA
ncbi:MATE family efflux transporter [Clostridium intestinale]|uniref:Multidrug export protein MepA n=1 Tax=Clostridium intestinale URNW TaxID=1294142 RepID=U2PYR6_9CLOT|nr:MATE family efflux transporter [Clostridium intestinale]ERK28929.1 na+ driven multidrug efflux pump [Clostridium intestinale URNW]